MKSHSAPTPVEGNDQTRNTVNVVACGNSHDSINKLSPPIIPWPHHRHAVVRRQSCSTIEDSPEQSRSPSLRPSLPSSATVSSICTVCSFVEFSTVISQRSSVLRRLRSSISTSSISAHTNRRPILLPLDLQTRPEKTEKRFVDAIGMIIPGVCDRKQCSHPRVHFVSTFRLCEPIEYTTALADHGITYTDYCRLVAALSNFLEESSFEARRRRTGSAAIDSGSKDANASLRRSLGTSSVPQRSTVFNTTEQLKKARENAVALNELLEEITWNLQARGLPVMICVSSFSLFAPHQISEAHIQVLHVTLDQMFQATLVSQVRPDATTTNSPMDKCLSFIDSSKLARMEERPSYPKHESQTALETTTSTTDDEPTHHYQPQKRFRQSHPRDRSKPTPWWPNAIPSRKRQVMSVNAERYGLDPYFRAWMRANINSRTRSKTFAKYMIEQEDDPFVNTRLEYAEAPSKGALVLDVLHKFTQVWKEQRPNTMNRAKYEHNRRLECRKTIEHGSRLRLVRFGFRHSIHPPHTAEMHGLGLTKTQYETILSKIDAIHADAHLNTKWPMSYLQAPLRMIRRRSSGDALLEVSEYIRELNASQRRIVWTIERIPSVFDKRLARDRSEWEISAWNGEDPLELLIQLERWGIIENRLGVDDED
ncbi:hypothetical protein BKA66DRAFT_524872 [Pyrenochaeta sp. MPI-SDFR-AT-0127]|nr:hypothetical protein BKA66DRAFT_524872 [Pyrenochaeta sp. MPI-SDFR-AT-0127]